MPTILTAIAELGYDTPTPIQEQVIPQLLEADHDLVGLAQTGTGKTAAFGIPLLHKIDLSQRFVQAVILCPTRELCLQITSDIKSYSKFMSPKCLVEAVYGGVSIVPQLRSIQKGVHIIVATPGRMLDVIERNSIKLEHVKYIVLDEADEMLNMGFIDDVDSILAKMPSEKSTWLFTATFAKEISDIARNYMENPIEISVGNKNTANVNITHQYYVVRASDKYAALKRMVDYNPDIFGIVFTRTKTDAKEIAEQLIKDGYNADALHGDLSQQQRDVVMNRYRERSLQLLIATDVAARGIDVSDVTHVIHYSLPDDIENYTHRSGRTARAGKTGYSVSIITRRDVEKIERLERKLKTTFELLRVPTGIEVCEKQLFHMVHRVHEVTVNEKQIGPFIDRINAEFVDLSKEEVIKKFASLEFNQFLEYYKDAADLNESVRRRQPDRSVNTMGSLRTNDGSRGAQRTSNYGGDSDNQCLNIGLGAYDGINKGDLVRLVCDTARVKSASLGKIMIFKTFSTIEVAGSIAAKIIQEFKGIERFGQPIHVGLDQGAPKQKNFSYRRQDDASSSNNNSRNRKFSEGGNNRERNFAPKKRRF
ncbi:MAG: DEAD/DEAH box helicase [Saprospiraceae bacterium]|nr:DEAD/DEAH box helicase [Saprospiraceae bacterium]